MNQGVVLYNQLVLGLEAAAAQAGVLPFLAANSIGPVDPSDFTSGVDESVARSLGGLAATKTDKQRIGGTDPDLSPVAGGLDRSSLPLANRIPLSHLRQFSSSVPYEHQIGYSAWSTRFQPAQEAPIPVQELKVTGDLYRGMVVRSTVPGHESEMIYVPPRGWIRREDKDGNMTFGHPATEGDVQSLEVQPLGQERALVRQLLDTWKTRTNIDGIPERQAWSSDLSGIEREYFVIDPRTGELVQLAPNFFDDDTTETGFLKQTGWGEELLEGMPEITEGEYTGAVASAQGSARRFTIAREKLKQMLGEDVIIVALPMLPTGTPNGTKISDNPYVQVVQARLFQQLMQALDRRETTGQESDLQFVLDQFAQKQGYDSARAMFEKLGDMRTWATAATHVSAGLMILPDDPSYLDDPEAYTGGFYALQEDMINLYQAIFSDPGNVLPRVMTMGGALYMGVPLVGKNGQLVLDAREATRNFLDTANENTVFIGGAKTLAGVIEKVTVARQRNDGALNVNGIVERLARAAGSTYKIDPRTGKKRLHANHHSPKGRIRVERTGGKTHRIENTGPGATDIRTKARIVALQNVWQTLSKIAMEEGLTFVQFIKRETGLTRRAIWNNAATILRDVNYERGIDSPLLERHLDQLVRIISILEKPAYQMKAKRETLAITHAAIRSMRQASQTLEGYAQTGSGPIGVVINNMIVEMRQQGLDDRTIALKIARRTHDYQKQEEEAFANASYQDALAYLTGEKEIPYKQTPSQTESPANEAPIVSANILVNDSPVLRRLYGLGRSTDRLFGSPFRAMTRQAFETWVSLRDSLAHVLSDLSSSGARDALYSASHMTAADPNTVAAFYHLRIERLARSLSALEATSLFGLSGEGIRKRVRQRTGLKLTDWELGAIVSVTSGHGHHQDAQGKRRQQRFTGR